MIFLVDGDEGEGLHGDIGASELVEFMDELADGLLVEGRRIGLTHALKNS